MLLTALWLYEDFPDVDLWVSTADEPSRCNLTVPILQFYVIPSADAQQSGGSSSSSSGSSSSTAASASSTSSSSSGISSGDEAPLLPFSVEQLLSGNGGWPGSSERSSSSSSSSSSEKDKGDAAADSDKPPLQYTRGFPIVTADVSVGQCGGGGLLGAWHWLRSRCSCCSCSIHSSSGRASANPYFSS